MNKDQARVIIVEKHGQRHGQRYFETWCDWMDNGRPTVWKLSQITGRKWSTLRDHLDNANKALHDHAMKQKPKPDLRNDAGIEASKKFEEHVTECRALCVITLDDNSEADTISDYPLYKAMVGDYAA